MFSLVSGVYDSYFAPTHLNLLVVGASGTGKTALLERLKVTQFTKNVKAPPLQLDQQVPQSFLPISLRSSAGAVAAPARRKKKKKKQQQPQHNNKRWACPAPARYANAATQDSSSSEEEDDDDDDDDVNAAPPPPQRNGLGRTSSQDMSLEDVPIGGDSELSDSARDDSEQLTKDDDDEEDDDEEDYDLKNQKIRMLPLHKIRPTIGQNLGKVEICGAQCRVWDLGGKMHDLWSRYYQDCDAVVFVWKIVDDSDPTQHITNENSNDDDSDDDQLPHVTAVQQLGLLEQVRQAIPDDIPFLVWGHWFPSISTRKKSKQYQYDEAYSTASLLPHYHNPLMSVYFGSAKSGAGVRTAMEWLIPTAARQKKFRDKSTAAAAAADENGDNPKS